MLLGLDLGTTNVKAILVAEDGAVAAQGSAPVALHHVADGGIEQDIEDIWEAALDAIRQAEQTADISTVRAIGISSQGGAIQVRTPQGRCIGPVISWMDARGAPFDERLTQELSEQWFADRVGHASSAIGPGQTLRLFEADLPYR